MRKHRFFSLSLVALGAVAIWASFFIWAATVRFGGDVRAFICIGESFRMPSAYVEIPRNGTWGYDGQFYAALASDPLHLKSETRLCLDNPIYRSERILVPILAWAVAFGNPNLTAGLYQMLGWLLALVGVLVTADMVGRSGYSPLWALPLAFSAGTAASVIRATPDAASTGLMLLALTLYARKSFGGSVVSTTASIFARETSLLVAGAIALGELRAKRWWRAILGLVIPTVLFGLYFAHLRSKLPAVGYAVPDAFGFPFRWLPEKIHQMLTDTPHFFGSNFWAGIGVLIAIAAAVALLLDWKTLTPTAYCFGAFALMGAVANFAVWSETWAFARVLSPLPFLAVMLALDDKRRWRQGLMLASAAFSVIGGIALIRGEIRDVSATRPIPAETSFIQRAKGTDAQTGLTLWNDDDLAKAWYVGPVASSRGRGDSEWHSDLRLTNTVQAGNRVSVEFLNPTQRSGQLRRSLLNLDPGEKRNIQDVVGTLFNGGGTGALRIVPFAGKVEIEAETYDITTGNRNGVFVASAKQALGYGATVRFAPLYSDPAHTARTNLGFLNPGRNGTLLEITLFDDADKQVGQMQAFVYPAGFIQVNDVFVAAKVGEVIKNGKARVRALNKGTWFLGYGTVLNAAQAEPVYLAPQIETPPVSK